MLMSFIVIGQKDKDTYVLYDNRAGFGGKACATLYTITQLIQGGYGICGVTPEGYTWVKQGKQLKASMLRIMTVDGKVATRIPAFTDLDDTKRRAGTFEKGIKRSRKEIQRAKEVGEKRSQTIQTKKESADPRRLDIIDFYKDILANGVEIKRMTPQKISSIYNYSLEKEQRVYDFEQLFDKNGTPMPAYYSRTKNVLVSRKKMLEKYNNIVAKVGLEGGKFVNYSFYTSEPPHSTPREVADYFMKHTTKQIKYTYGLKFRGPTTCEKPISHEEAMRIWSRNGMFDVREHEDWVDFQEVSGNDMW